MKKAKNIWYSMFGLLTAVRLPLFGLLKPSIKFGWKVCNLFFYFDWNKVKYCQTTSGVITVEQENHKWIMRQATHNFNPFLKYSYFLTEPRFKS